MNYKNFINKTPLRVALDGLRKRKEVDTGNVNINNQKPSITVTNRSAPDTNDFISLGAAVEFDDELFSIVDDGDDTKKVQFECSDITTATTRELTIPDEDGKIVVTDTALTDNTIIRGDGGASGVQDTGITISDTDAMTWGGDAGITRNTTNLLQLLSGDALLIPGQAGDFATTTDGIITFDSSVPCFKFRQNAGWVSLPDSIGTGDVTAASTMADNTIIRGDGGSKGVQDSGWTIDDNDVMTGTSSGTTDTLNVTYSGTTALQGAVFGNASGATGTVVGVGGITQSSDNSSYGVVADNFSGNACLFLNGSTAAGASMDFDDGTTPTDPDSGKLRLYADSTLKQLVSIDDNSKEIPLNEAVLDCLTSNSTISNTVTETGIDSFSLDANQLEAGTSLRWVVRGKIQAFTGSPTVTIRIKLDSTAYLTFTTAGLSAGQYTYVLTCDLVCQTAGSTGTVMSAGEMSYYDGTTMRHLTVNTGTATTTNTTLAHTLGVTGQWSAANANNILTTTQVILEQLN